jgi:hypothetical protein
MGHSPKLKGRAIDLVCEALVQPIGKLLQLRVDIRAQACVRGRGQQEDRGECQTEDARRAELQDVDARHALLGPDEGDLQKRPAHQQCDDEDGTCQDQYGRDRQRRFEHGTVFHEANDKEAGRGGVGTTARLDEHAVLHAGDLDASFGDAGDDGMCGRLTGVRGRWQQRFDRRRPHFRRPSSGDIHQLTECIGQEDRVERTLIDFWFEDAMERFVRRHSDADRCLGLGSRGLARKPVELKAGAVTLDTVGVAR